MVRHHGDGKWTGTYSPVFADKLMRVATNGQEVKYGIISTARLIQDLEGWDTLYTAGRLHKPVHPFPRQMSELTRRSSRSSRHPQ